MLQTDPPRTGPDIPEREKHALALEAIAERKCRKGFTELFDFFAPRLKSYLMRLGSDDIQAEELAVLGRVHRAGARHLLALRLGLLRRLRDRCLL